ncbi:ABC transporter permease [Niabella beijingensis]|uniref:ABC transporter permease n=1 Tax=Niabella beijingensis TaxID=2872700 RepID=UPI001CBEAFB6|nr:ABC transporter permease [Niabella beijingensis]MBZ4191481.1 ABC transporter permease [Niabella beijingensis]
MIRNYIKIAWRNIRKQVLYSSVNIIGLFAGILFFFLIGAYVWSEFRVNRELKNAGNQYILTSLWKNPDMGTDLATIGPLAKRLKEDYPRLVRNYYRFDGITAVVAKGDKKLKQDVQLGDSGFLTMYGFKLLGGNAATALEQPFSVVITKKIAFTYFNSTDVIGQTLAIRSFSGDIHDFKITAVLDELPENTVTQLTSASPSQVFVPVANYDYFGRTDLDSWQNIYIASYIELQNGVKAADLKAPIEQLLKQNTTETVQQYLRVAPVPLTKYHLSRNNGLIQRTVYTLSLVGLFILIMAVINFVNVSISNAGTRIREIGVRKVIGGRRRQLVFQFLSESVILVALAVLLALAAYPVTKGVFADVVGKPLPSLFSFPPYFVVFPLLLILVIGVLSGLYPALRLSSINMINAMKGTLKSVGEHVLLRKGLVTFQFAVALLVLVAAFVITRQVMHFFSRSLGYNKEFMVSAQVPRDWSKPGVDKMISIRDQFAALPEVTAVSLSYEIPNGNNGGQAPVYKMGTDTASALPFQVLSSDEKYLNTYGIALKEGRSFEGYRRDSGQVILNETGARVLGYQSVADAVGKKIQIPGDPTLFTVKGVAGDFHFGSMLGKIPPILIFNINFNPTYRFLSFRLKPGNVQASLDALQKKWSSLIPETAFEYRFMDDDLQIMYAKELQLKKAAYVAGILALVIVLLGIFSLVSLSIQKRIKEIGVRKVLGASASSIVRLLAREFVVVLLIAVLVAVPLGYWLMSRWLQNYAYHIKIAPEIFVVAFFCIAFVTFLLIAAQAAKAAFANPVKALRSE